MEIRKYITGIETDAGLIRDAYEDGDLDDDQLKAAQQLLQRAAGLLK